MSKTKQRSYEWHGSFAMAALSTIQDFWNSDSQYARAEDWANLVEWTIPAEDKEPLPFTWGSIDETDIDNIINFTHLHNTIRCTIVLINHTRCIKAHSSHLPSSQPSVPMLLPFPISHPTCWSMAHLLRYDMAELQEMGRGAECGLRKLQNGIRVFHYIG